MLKRTSPGLSDDEKPNCDSDAFQHDQFDQNAKRAKLTTFDPTALNDLPTGLMQRILIKVIAMEVKAMKLARCVWSEKADLVVSRLRSVCPQWNSILTTNSFRNELLKTLEGTALDSIRVEVLCQSPLPFRVYRMAVMNDTIYLLCKSRAMNEWVITVYDRNNLAEVEDVIPLPGMRTSCIAACSVSNCLYLLNAGKNLRISVLRLAKNDKQEYDVSVLFSALFLTDPNLSTTPNGCLVLSRPGLGIVFIYNPNGSLQHVMWLPPDLADFHNLIPKSDGTFVMVSSRNMVKTNISEIDVNGTITRQSRFKTYKRINHTDIHGRVMLIDRGRLELLDDELNLLDFAGQQQDGSQFISSNSLQYNRERNEVVTIVCDKHFQNGLLTIFRLREE